MISLDTALIRTLDAHGVNYRLHPHDEPVFTVDAAVKQRGVVKEYRDRGPAVQPRNMVCKIPLKGIA